MTLLDELSRRFPSARRTTLRRMIRDGRVRVAGEVARSAKTTVPDGAAVDVSDRIAPPRRRTDKWPVPVIHEDADLIVIDKPQGLMTQSGPRDRRPTLIGLLQTLLAGRDGPSARVRLVHRLDADAAGVIMFAKTNAAQQALKRQFADHSAERVYLAQVAGKPPRTGRIASRLVELADGRVRTSRHTDHGELAITHYQRLATDGKVSLLRVRLETGKKHQIRVHLSENGWPIIGDPLYQPRRQDFPLRLVAVELTVTHPRTGRRETYRAALPDWADLPD
jgi:23S rRNA pseudouridine1911/1915/1917 synthase